MAASGGGDVGSDGGFCFRGTLVKNTPA